METFLELRAKHPVFTYESFSYAVHEGALHIEWVFSLAPDIVFRPKLQIPTPDNYSLESLDSFVFSIGMVELLSYWKAACSPTIIVKAGSLSPEQLEFWRDLLIHGMGEYFFQNDIDFTAPGFVEMQVVGEAQFMAQSKQESENRIPKNLLLVGGGKDSVVALETVKATGEQAQVLLVNPTPAAIEVSRIAGYEQPIVVSRAIDPLLLELNERGYLNGHTPFSALLAFIAALVAQLNGFNQLVVGNERSSDEGNINWREQEINHQYSKSQVFEAKVRDYIKQNLSEEITYFSLLRPLYELQIARGFSQFPQYFDHFLSCNRSKTTWCRNCPKCLFTFCALAPFVGLDKTITIFGGDVLRNLDLIPLVDASLNETNPKPFECVGTREETRMALCLCVPLYGDQLPPVLAYAHKHYVLEKNESCGHLELVHSWGNDSALPDSIREQLQRIITL
jgi:7-cyano-7-deazaguanine synthase in queuosine biosynthesis